MFTNYFNHLQSHEEIDFKYFESFQLQNCKNKQEPFLNREHGGFTSVAKKEWYEMHPDFGCRC